MERRVNVAWILNEHRRLSGLRPRCHVPADILGVGSLPWQQRPQWEEDSFPSSAVPPKTYLARGVGETDSEVEVGVCAAWVDPQVIQNGRQNRCRHQHTGHQEVIPHDCKVQNKCACHWAALVIAWMLPHTMRGAEGWGLPRELERMGHWRAQNHGVIFAMQTPDKEWGGGFDRHNGVRTTHWPKILLKLFILAGAVVPSVTWPKRPVASCVTTWLHFTLCRATRCGTSSMWNASPASEQYLHWNVCLHSGSRDRYMTVSP